MQPTQPLVEESPSRKTALAFLGGARAALAFLTRIPCGTQPVDARALAWAAAWFPLVGCVLGGAGGLIDVALAPAGSFAAAVATVAFLALVTGAFHEDGLADSADALGGAFDREKLFLILKDSRIGSFGATALIVVLLLRIAALAKLGPQGVGALIAGQTLSRTMPVLLMTSLPYVTPAENARAGNLVGATAVHGFVAVLFSSLVVTGLVVAHALALNASLLAIAVALASTAVCGWRFHVRAGGITGDFLGATQQVSDAVMLLTFAMVA